MTEAANRIQELEAALQIVKDACDRDWADETPKQVATIASNAMFWRNDEIRRLRDALAQKTRECEDAKHSHQLAQAGWELTLKNLIDAQAQVEQLERQVAELKASR